MVRPIRQSMNLFKRTALTRTLFFVSSDIALIVISILLAFLMRFDGQIPPHYYQFIIRMAALAIIFTIPIFYFQRLYSFSWSYVSANEAISLFKASLISFLFLSIAIYISNYFPKFQNFPRSTIFISYILIFTLCGALRFSKKIYLHIRGSSRLMEKERTLIVGAGDAGEQILRNMLSSAKNNYYPVGFVDDSNIKQGVKIHGLKVLGKISDLPRIIVNSEIRQLIIALPSASNKVIKQAVELGRSAGLKKIKIAPPMNEIIRGEVSLKNLKDVGVEDLLGRDPVGLDKKQIENFIKDNVVLITGAAGSIGSELTRQVAKFRPSKLVLLDQDETGIFAIAKEMQDKFPMLQMPSLIADIRDKEKMDAVFKEFHPQIVFHAAAYKHVPLMELQPDEAVKNNVFGTEILADISAEHGVEKFIFISTDKAVNPTSVMGATKRAGEMICQEHNQAGGAKFISVRFGNVLNSRGSVIPIFREQIRKGGPVEVTDPEMKRYFMLTSEACLLVMQAGAMGQGGEVFVLDMGKPVKILDLAREMIKLSGFEPDKDIAIVFVGIRPGEKLFEEILTAEEGTLVTQNQKIFMAKLSLINVGEFAEKLERLKESAIRNNKEEIIKNLKQMISSFVNQS